MVYIKSLGKEGLPLIECINPKYQKYRVRWNVELSGEGDPQMATFVEAEFDHKPSISEVKGAILGWMNERIDERIISGFVWKDMLVWLSTENQFNYKAAYDIAVQSNGVNLPITFKFGDTENPVYYKFTTLDDLREFYLQAMTYINTQLENGWAEKDAFDWAEYESLLMEE